MTGQRRVEAVTVAGVRSPVAVQGPDDAQDAVVCVHGNPGAKEDWFELLDRLPDGTRALAPDMPAYGDADAPAHFPYTVDGYARHLGGLLDALGVRRAHLVLHDFGGPWGLRWAALHGDRVASITLCNTGALVDYRWHHFAKVWRTPGVGELAMRLSKRPIMMAALGRENPRLGKHHLARIFDQFDRPATQRAILKLYRATDPAGMAGDRQALSLLGVPVLVVWGGDDRYIPIAQAHLQTKTFPGARVELHPELGHWAFLEDPDRVLGAVVPFLVEQAA